MAFTDYYKTYQKTKQIIDYQFDTTIGILGGHELSTLSKIAPNLVPTDFKKLIKTTQELKDEHTWEYIWNECKLTRISRLVDTFEIFLKDFTVDTFKRHKNLLPKISLEFKTPNDLFSQSSKSDLENLLWQKTEYQLRWVNFSILLGYLKMIQTQKNYLNLDRQVIDRVQKAKKIRNQYVHWRGIIDQDFKKDIGIANLVIGNVFEPTDRAYVQLTNSIDLFASSLNLASPAVRDKLVQEAMMKVLHKLSIGEPLVPKK